MGFTTLANMGIKVPDRGNNNWDAEILTTFTKLDAHDHTTGKGVQIPTNGFANDAITSAKVLLANNAGLRQKDVGGTARTIINLDASDVLNLQDALGNEILTAAATASAVNHLAMVNSTTGNSPALQSDGSDSNIGLRINDSNGNELLDMVAVASAVNQLQVTNSAAGNPVLLEFAGGDTNGTLRVLGKGSGGTGTSTTLRDANDNEYFEHVATASAVNHLKTTNAATGNDPVLEPDGGDTNANLHFKGKGTGSMITPTTLLDVNKNEYLEHAATASAVNHMKTTNAATGNPTILEPAGGDTNINALYRGKGTGTSIVEALNAGWVTNLSMSLSGGTFTIEGAGGVALSATNPAFVVLPSKATPGRMVSYTITANQAFIDDAGSSEIINNLFGATTGVAWAVDTPFYIYAVGNNDEDTIAFMIGRVPHMTTSPAVGEIGAPDDAVADESFSLFSFDSLDETLFDLNPCLAIGSMRMRMTTSDDWTVQTLGNQDGIGKFQEGIIFDMPAGHSGADAGKFMLTNSGTAPDFSANAYRYTVRRDGSFELHAVFTADGGDNGASAVDIQFILPVAIHATQQFSFAAGYDGTTHALGILFGTETYFGTFSSNAGNTLPNLALFAGATRGFTVMGSYIGRLS